LRLQRLIMPAVANNENELGCGELNKNDPEDEQHARAQRHGLWLVDPQLGDRHCQDEERDDEILCRLGLLSAEDKKGQAGDERGQDNYFDVTRGLQGFEQLVAGAATALLLGSESPLQQPSAS